MINDTTAHLRLPLPHLKNFLEIDVDRLREAFAILDGSAAQTAADLAAQRETSAAQQTALEQQDAALAQVAQVADNATRDIRTETAARQSADAGHDATLAALRQELDALSAKVETIKVDPWDVFPPRVPIAVDGVTFPTGANARHPIMPGETNPRLDWLICDGGADGKGGTVPDLRDRMILGASASRPAGSTGGSATHAHSVSGTVGATTLSVGHLAYHTHATWAGQGAIYGSGVPAGQGQMFNTSNGIGYAGGNAAHVHGLTVSSGAASSLPPHYSLAFIMRIA